MKITRAICISDIRHDNCPVFELKENGWFEMLEDAEFRYEKEVVEDDKDWLIFEVNTDEDEVNIINK